METSTILELIPLAGKIGVVTLLLLWIRELTIDKKQLKKHLNESIESHLKDMRDNSKDMQDFTNKFNSFANELKDILRK